MYDEGHAAGLAGYSLSDAVEAVEEQEGRELRTDERRRLSRGWVAGAKERTADRIIGPVTVHEPA